MKNSSLRVSTLGAFVLFAAALALTVVTHAAEADDQPAKQTASKDGHNSADNPLHLTAEKRKAAGIVLARPAAVTLAPEIEAYGRIIDPAPLVTLLAEGETARGALAASEKELTRVKTLFQNGANASAQAVETAEANLARDRAAMDSAHLRLVAAWGRAFGDNNRVAEIRAALEQGAVLARLDVLTGDQPADPMMSAAVRLASGGSDVAAEVLGPSATADPQVQGRGFLALIRNGSFPIGAALRATLPGAGSAVSAVAVARSAIVYHEGSAWLYVLGKNDTFERKLVTVVRPVDNGVALRGIGADDEVVTVGAEELLAAELQAGTEGVDERD